MSMFAWSYILGLFNLINYSINKKLTPPLIILDKPPDCDACVLLRVDMGTRTWVYSCFIVKEECTYLS